MNMKDMPKRFYIICGNHTYNRGDRANLISQIDLINRYFPGVQITADSLDPEQDAPWYPVKIISKKGIFFPLIQLRTALRNDVIIWGGGALIADNSCRLIVPYWFFLLFIIKYIFRKKIFGWAHGVVLETHTGKFFASLILNLPDVITVRDGGSLKSLRSLNCRKQIEVTADPAFTLEMSDRATGESILKSIGLTDSGRKIAGLSFTFWPFYHDSRDWFPIALQSGREAVRPDKKSGLEAYVESIVSTVNFLTGKLNMEVLLIPRYVKAPWKDIEILRGIRGRLVKSDSAFILSEDHPPKDLFSVWKCFDLHVGSALHDSIVALRCHVPSVHIAYEQKGIDLFESYGMQDFLIDFRLFLNADGVEDCCLKAERALEQSSEIRAKERTAGTAMSEKAERNAVLLQQYLKRETCETNI